MKRLSHLRSVSVFLVYFFILIFLAGVKGLPGIEDESKPIGFPDFPEYVSGEVLVHFGDLGASEIKAIKESLHLRMLDSIPQLGVHRLQIENGAEVSDVIMALLDKGVAYADPNYIRRPMLLSNDPDFGQLYGFTKMSVEQAWNTTTGGNIVVAVIDTGGDFGHIDLAENTWVNPNEDVNGNGIFDNDDLNGVDDDGNGFIDDVIGYNFADNTPIPYNNASDDLHGTHVSGTIGAVGNNGTGIVGMLWNVKIMRLKFLSGSGGTDFNGARAITYAVDNGARISNNSWGGSGTSTTLSNAVRYASDNDMVFVAAAGNSANNNDRFGFYPASYTYENVVSVAATDRNDRLASFSNYGSKTVDVAAPGVSIYSTFPNDRYGNLDGTSMASPHAAGLAALIRLANPNLSATEVRTIMINTSDPVSSLSSKVYSGGRLNAARALECATTGNNCDRQADEPDPGRCGMVNTKTQSVTSLLVIFGFFLLLIPFSRKQK